MHPGSLRRPLRIAVFLQLETEHGRGVLRGIAQFFRQHPEVTVLKFGKAERYQLFELHRLNVDGIIAKVANLHDERTLAGLRIPVVNVSGTCATPKIPTVNTDDERVGRMAARHFLSRGYRSLGYCGDNAHLASRLRSRGFVSEARAAAVRKVQTISLVRSDANAALQPEVMQWIQKLPKPVGVFGFTDQMAIAIAEAGTAAGFEVPQQLAILGVGNDLTRLDFAHVDVSSIQLNTQRIGQLAGEILYGQLATGARIRKLTLLPPVKIATRKSTDVFAVDDDAVAQALDYIRENVGNTIYVDEVARAAGMSRRLLEMKFRRDLKSTVYGEVQRAHFERAIELMGEPELTLSEIAYASGFESAQRFSTSFSRRYGQSPLSYRTQMRVGRNGAARDRARVRS